MNRRLIATTLGCACILGASAGIASHYVGRDTAQPVPLFLMSAQQADPRLSWPPPEGSVAFNDEMIALLTMGASVSVAARETARDVAQEAVEAQPQRRMSRQERRRAQQEERARLRAERAQARDERGPTRDYRAPRERETVEVHVKDREGNTVRVQRVEREFEDDRPRAYAPSRFRLFGPFGRW